MSTIWDVTQDALSGISDLGIPVASGVMLSATKAPLPDLYIVYQLVSSPPLLHADNYEDMRWYRMQVSVYSRNGLNDLPDVGSAMVEAGFTKSTVRELPYNQETRHFGLALDFIYTSDSETESESY